MDMQLKNIIEKINNLYTHHINNNEGIIIDGNIEGYASRYRYMFIDNGAINNNIEHDKVIFLNEVMEIFNELLIHGDAPTETPSETINLNCTGFNCNPKCKCGKWDYEQYVQEENYMNEEPALQKIMGEMEIMNLNENKLITTNMDI